MSRHIYKEALVTAIKQLQELSDEQKSDIIGLIRTEKSYGLVWEDSKEEAYEILKTKVPILREVSNKTIHNDSKDEQYPNHILIEGENLQTLVALTYTHAGMIDVIYIDPPYNTGARDWKYNNDYVDSIDGYRHSKWLSMMKHRLQLAKQLLRNDESVLIVTIDEKEYLHLGCMLEEMFVGQRIQMVSVNIHPGGVARDKEFARSDEYYFFVYIGEAGPHTLELDKSWLYGIETTSRDKVHWRGLLRSGSNDSRRHSPGCFYPIFVAEDGKRIVEVGEALPIEQPKEEILCPEGVKVVFPIHANGDEGCWQCSPNVLREIIKKGYVKLGGFTKRGMSINYLAKGEQNKVEKGLFEIIGRNEDGSLILNDDDYKARFIPTTQWNVKLHDALRNGTGLLNNILGPKVFPYPKSLYAVSDSLKFFIDNKPNSIILDFFAGSGTTMHATMQLNAEDGGHRQCILVTNNENNICEEVTYERNKRVIEGYTTPKGEQVEGLKKNNLRYYKVELTDREQNHQQNKELVKGLKDLLCIKENIYQEVDTFGSLSLTGKEQMLRCFVEGERQMLMVYDSIVIPYLVKEIERMTQKTKIYLFADGAYPYTEDFRTVLDKIDLVPLPYAYQRAIKYALPDADPAWKDNADLTEEELQTMMAEAIEAENNER